MEDERQPDDEEDNEDDDSNNDNAFDVSSTVPGRSSFIDDGDYGFDYPRERRHLAEARRKPADPRWPTPR